MHRRRFCDFQKRRYKTSLSLYQCPEKDPAYYTLVCTVLHIKYRYCLLQSKSTNSDKRTGEQTVDNCFDCACAVLGRFNFCISLVALSLYEVQTKAGLLGNRTRHAIFSPLLDAFFLDSHGHFRRRGRRWRWIKLLFWIGRIPVHS